MRIPLGLVGLAHLVFHVPTRTLDDGLMNRLSHAYLDVPESVSALVADLPGCRPGDEAAGESWRPWRHRAERTAGSGEMVQVGMQAITTFGLLCATTGQRGRAARNP